MCEYKQKIAIPSDIFYDDGDGVMMVMLVFWLWKPSHDFPSIWNSNLHSKAYRKIPWGYKQELLYTFSGRSSMMMIMMSVFWL